MPCAITPGQADAERDLLVLVDRVVVAAGVGVGDQVGARDREGLRGEDVAGCEAAHAAPSCPAECTSVALPVQTTAPVASVISLLVAMMSAPPIWRSAGHGERGAELVAGHEGTGVGEALLAVDDAVQVDPLGVEERLHGVEGQDDREGRRDDLARDPGWPTAAAKALTRSGVTVRGAGAGNSRPTREGSTGMSRP